MMWFPVVFWKGTETSVHFYNNLENWELPILFYNLLLVGFFFNHKIKSSQTNMEDLNHKREFSWIFFHENFHFQFGVCQIDMGYI